jgi:AcrR family transcriptional regulator
MHTFWSSGLNTTLKDLQTATGLSKSSIYNTYGNKEALFGLSMACYVDFMEEWVKKTFCKTTFKEFLKAVLEDAATNNFEGRGCFFYNCLGNRNVANQENKEALDLAYSRIKKIFESRILLAIQTKELNINTNTAGYATLLMTTIAGLRAFNLSGLPKIDLQNAAVLAFDKLI